MAESSLPSWLSTELLHSYVGSEVPALGGSINLNSVSLLDSLANNNSNNNNNNNNNNDNDNNSIYDNSNESANDAIDLRTVDDNLPQDTISVIGTPRMVAGFRIKLPLISPTSSDSENDVSNQIAPDGSVAIPNAQCDNERPPSPPPNCAICLSRCRDKCFTDSCMHQFCFKCLCEWSKVKPECPLCKQNFKSIIHNVKSINQFEEYHVQAPAVNVPLGRTFQLESYGLLSYGNRYVLVPPAHLTDGFTAGNSATSSTRAFSINLLQDYYRRNPGVPDNPSINFMWRNYVYDRKLYALPLCDITGRFRECSARFYRNNPAQVHRLVPWIRRELECLLGLTNSIELQALETITDALPLVNIMSPGFRRRLQPILGTKTVHFMHELHTFARSPFDLIGYDRAVRYSAHWENQVVFEFSLSESDGEESIPSIPDQSNPTYAVTNAINLSVNNGADHINDNVNQNRNRDSVIELNDESDNENPTTSAPPAYNQNRQRHAPGVLNFNSMSTETRGGDPPRVAAENIELFSSSSDECVFVLERKPPHLRTPEMVSLDSASDSDVVFVKEIKSANTSGRTAVADSLITTSSGRLNRFTESRNYPNNYSNSEQLNDGASTSTGMRMTRQKRKMNTQTREARDVRWKLRRKRNTTFNPCHKQSYSQYTSNSENSNCTTAYSSSTNVSEFSSTDRSYESSDDSLHLEHRGASNRNNYSRKKTRKKTSGRNRRSKSSCNKGNKQTDSIDIDNDNANGDDDDENSWRVAAVNDELKKRQMHQVRNLRKRTRDNRQTADADIASTTDEELRHKRCKSTDDLNIEQCAAGEHGNTANDVNNDDDDDEDETDNLNLSTLKTILKAEIQTVTSIDNNSPTASVSPANSAIRNIENISLPVMEMDMEAVFPVSSTNPVIENENDDNQETKQNILEAAGDPLETSVAQQIHLENIEESNIDFELTVNTLADTNSNCSYSMDSISSRSNSNSNSNTSSSTSISSSTPSTTSSENATSNNSNHPKTEDIAYNMTYDSI